MLNFSKSTRDLQASDGRMLEAALALARKRSFPVLPLHWITENGECSCMETQSPEEESSQKCKPGKHPYSLPGCWHGCKDATTNANQISAWWKSLPHANIGIATGGGLLVIDGDLKDGGDKSLEALQSAYGPLPPTLTAISGSGGPHYYYRLPDGVTVQSKRLCNYPGMEAYKGIDIKSQGAYVVAPPSIHLSGQRYRWVDPDAPIADAPDWLVDIFLSAQPVANPGWKKEPQQGSVIDVFNKAFSITEILDRNGYTLARKGRYKRPDGSSSSVVILNGTYSYHHSSNDNELLCDGHKHDAFSAFCALEHMGDVKAAVKVAARVLGLSQSTAEPRSAQQTGEAQEENPQERQRASQVNQLIAIAQAHATFFRTPEGEFYANVQVEQHQETMPIVERGGSFRRWLLKSHLDLYGSVPNPTALTSAIQALAALAQYGVKPQKPITREVHTRIAWHAGSLYLDLADDDRNVVEIDGTGWRVIKDAPVHFRHPVGMLPLPVPKRGGKFDELRQFINTATEDDWMLIASFVLMTFHPHGPYPTLELHGEQGTAKSTATRLLRQLVDPSKAPARKEPKEERDLAIQAKNARIVALENLSHLPPWLSDAICRLNTGAGDGGRKLYTDDEETIFQARRPVVMNGIVELATHGDLLDRTIVVELQVIPPSQRKTEKELAAVWEQAHPSILGALLDVVSTAIRNWQSVCLPSLPRMADFAIWTTAAEPALGWKPGAWRNAYETNRTFAVSTELEASPVASAIKKLLADVDEWHGTATALSEALAGLTSLEVLHSRAWPKGPRALSGALKRLAPSLRQIGIFAAGKKHNDHTYYTLLKQATGGAKGGANEGREAQNGARVAQMNHHFAPDPTCSGGASGASGANSPSFSSVEIRGKEGRRERGEGEEGKIEKEGKFAPLAPLTPERDLQNQAPTSEGTAALQSPLVSVAVQEEDEAPA